FTCFPEEGQRLNSAFGDSTDHLSQEGCQLAITCLQHSLALLRLVASVPFGDNPLSRTVIRSHRTAFATHVIATRGACYDLRGSATERTRLQLHIVAHDWFLRFSRYPVETNCSRAVSRLIRRPAAHEKNSASNTLRACAS